MSRVFSTTVSVSVARMMKRIAVEMALSETGFILPSERGDFRLRYFSRGGDEVTFCGHATIGALYAIEREGRFGVEDEERYHFQVETHAGLLPMEIDLTQPQGNVFKFMPPKVEMEKAPVSLEALMQAMDLKPDQVDMERPLRIDRGRNYLFFAASSLEKLGDYQVDGRALRRYCLDHNIVLVCALTPHAFNPKHHVHNRAYAPAVGVDEDPFTGSLQAGLVTYLREQEMIPLNQTEICSEQGHFIGRPGHVKIEVVEQDPLGLQMHAEAVHVFETVIQMP